METVTLNNNNKIQMKMKIFEWLRIVYTRRKEGVIVRMYNMYIRIYYYNILIYTTQYTVIQYSTHNLRYYDHHNIF